MSRSASLVEGSGLADDVWLQIALEAEALDIVALSQCCTQTHSLFLHKHTWTKILRSVMRRYGNFIVAYSIDGMSLEQIRKAAVAPELWRKLVATKSVPWTELGPDCGDVRWCSTRIWRSLPLPHQVFHLIPGGRFLVTGGLSWEAEAAISMTLWDLGSPLEGGLDNPIPIASCTLQCDIGHGPLGVSGITDIDVVGDSSFNMALTFSFSYSPAAAQETMTVVISGSLGEESSRLRQVASLRSPCEITRKVSIRGDRVLIQPSKGDPILWKYTESHARACTPMPLMGPSYLETILLEDYVVLLVTGGAWEGIMIYDITLLDVDSEETALRTWSTPHGSCFVPFSWISDFPEKRVVVTPSRMPSRTRGNCVQFDVFHTNGVQRFEVNPAQVPVVGPVTNMISALGSGSLRRNRVLVLPTGILAERDGGRPSNFFAYDVQEDASPHLTCFTGEGLPPALCLPMGTGDPTQFCAYTGRALYAPPGARMRFEQMVQCADYLPFANMKSKSKKRMETSRSSLGPGAEPTSTTSTTTATTATTSTKKRPWSKPAKKITTSLNKLLRLA